MWKLDGFPDPPESGPHDEGLGFYLKWIARAVTPIFKFKWKKHTHKKLTVLHLVIILFPLH